MIMYAAIVQLLSILLHIVAAAQLVYSEDIVVGIAIFLCAVSLQVHIHNTITDD